MGPQFLADTELWRTTPQKEIPLNLPHKDTHSTPAPHSTQRSPRILCWDKEEAFLKEFLQQKAKVSERSTMEQVWSGDMWVRPGMASSVHCDSILKWVLGVVLKVWAQNSSMGIIWECVRDANLRLHARCMESEVLKEASGEGVWRGHPVILRLAKVWEQLS